MRVYIGTENGSKGTSNAMKPLLKATKCRKSVSTSQKISLAYAVTNAPVQNQSLAEAALPPSAHTQRHYHKLSEEFYFILEGAGEMEIDGEMRSVGPGDAILIPPGAWHEITAAAGMRFLCCCAPPYSHEDTYFE